MIAELHVGVPQGSIFGPIYFYHINDIDKLTIPVFIVAEGRLVQSVHSQVSEERKFSELWRSAQLVRAVPTNPSETAAAQ